MALPKIRSILKISSKRRFEIFLNKLVRLSSEFKKLSQKNIDKWNTLNFMTQRGGEIRIYATYHTEKREDLIKIAKALCRFLNSTQAWRK